MTVAGMCPDCDAWAGMGHGCEWCSEFAQESGWNVRARKQADERERAAVLQGELRIDEMERRVYALRVALRHAYPYVMDALREAEENTPATAQIVRDDLELVIVPALGEAVA